MRIVPGHKDDAVVQRWPQDRVMDQLGRSILCYLLDGIVQVVHFEFRVRKGEAVSEPALF